VSLDTGALAPLRGVSRRGKKAICEVPSDEHSSEYPTNWEFGSETRLINDWLVAPILERRAHARGVVAVRRGVTFEDEDKEVLILSLRWRRAHSTLLNSVETFNRVRPDFAY